MNIRCRGKNAAPRAGRRIFFLFSVMAVATVRFLPVAAAEPVIRSIADLTGRPVGILVGSILDRTAERHIDYVSIEYYDDYGAMEKALLAGEIDALFGDEPLARQRAADDPRLRALDEYMDAGDYSFATRFADAELHRSIDKLIREFKEDGTIDRLAEKWLDGPEGGKVLPVSSGATSGPALRFGTCPDAAPFSYRGADGRIVGMDVELATLIARRLGRDLDVEGMAFGSMIPTLLKGNVDLIGGALTITPERAKIASFTKGYYRIGITLLVRAE